MSLYAVLALIPTIKVTITCNRVDQQNAISSLALAFRICGFFFFSFITAIQIQLSSIFAIVSHFVAFLLVSIWGSLSFVTLSPCGRPGTLGWFDHQGLVVAVASSSDSSMSASVFLSFGAG